MQNTFETTVTNTVVKTKPNHDIFEVGGESLELYTPTPYSIAEGDQIVPSKGEPRILQLLAGGKELEASKELAQIGAKLARLASSTVVRASDNYDIRETGGNVTILTSSVGLSAELAPGTFAIDRDRRIVVSAEQGISMDWDCDGDPISVIMKSDIIDVELPSHHTLTKVRRTKTTSVGEGRSNQLIELSDETVTTDVETTHKAKMTKTHGVLIKFPMTRPMPNMQLAPLPQDKFTALTIDEVNESLARQADPSKDQVYAATKTFSKPPVGAVTKYWWAHLLDWAVTNHPEDICEGVYQAFKVHGDEFRIDLEERGMKAVRGMKADGKDELIKPLIFDTPVKMPLGPTNWFFGTKGALKFARVTNYDDMRSINALDAKSFVFDEPQVWKEGEREAEGWTNRDIIGTKSLVHHLMQAGLLVADNLAPNREGVPNAISLTLWSTKSNQPSAFTWVKDTGQETAGYNCILYPILAYDMEEGKSRVMSPLEHLSYWLARHFQCPYIYSTNFIKNMFDEDMDKAHALESAIRKYVSNYGDNVPATKVDGRYYPNKYAQYFAERICAIDFASLPQWNPEFPTELMVKRVEFAETKFGKMHWASTGSKNICRKFFFAEEDGLPEFVKRGTELPCQPHRPGRNRSLLIRSCARIRAKVAIVKTGSIQCFITPSGVNGTQPEDNVFLPEISAYPVEGWEMKTFSSWTGELRYVWTSPEPKRESKRVGKFVCPNGSRFEPRSTNQWTIKDSGTNIDFLYAYEELVDKALDQLFLSKATLETIVCEDGREVEAYVLDWILFRSGAASENIKPRYLKRLSLDGFYGLLLAGSMKNADIDYTRGNDEMLEESFKYFRASANISNNFFAEFNPEDGYSTIE